MRCIKCPVPVNLISTGESMLDLGGEKIDTAVPLSEVMLAAKRTAPKKQIYHLDTGPSEIR